MELVLLRTYHADGTNGQLLHNGALVCSTIELPWKDNQPRVSCIPEGRYELKKRYSPRRGHHLIVQSVAGRSLILVHPANDALRELQGCIAPVSVLRGQGKGSGSRPAFEKLKSLVYKVLPGEAVFLTIKTTTP